MDKNQNNDIDNGTKVVPHSTKVYEKDKTYFDNLHVTEGGTHAGTLEVLVNAHKEAQRKDALSKIKNLSTVKHHLKRLEEIYISSAEELLDKDQMHQVELELLKEQLKDAKLRSQEAIESRDQVLEETKLEIDRVRTEAMEQIELAEKTVEDTIATTGKTVAETQQQLDRMERLAQLQEQEANRAKEKADSLEKKALQADQLEEELEQAKLHIIQLNQDLQALQLEKDREISDITRQFEAEKELSQERCRLATEGAKLEAEQKASSDIDHLRNEIAQLKEEKSVLSYRVMELEHRGKEK
ncbi:chromosome segregation ATPase [Croceifilum oryzae]|uniref:Chromosome segregation ATPase n=1 Tax=Croceifilum oryzae TaxID=1553429 RepID=A0AAJ1TM58_9BACL|nr:hypothetical protein [Croceifilum oryzae]MDQ0418729.1 chromosome segregation ATPase [Croceifilum oryzae]